jgi:hypothetical protein
MIPLENVKVGGEMHGPGSREKAQKAQDEGGTDLKPELPLRLLRLFAAKADLRRKKDDRGGDE